MCARKYRAPATEKTNGRSTSRAKRPFQPATYGSASALRAKVARPTAELSTSKTTLGTARHAEGERLRICVGMTELERHAIEEGVSGQDRGAGGGAACVGCGSAQRQVSRRTPCRRSDRGGDRRAGRAAWPVDEAAGGACDGGRAGRPGPDRRAEGPGGTFVPRIVRKRQRRFEGFNDQILAVYARGLSTRDIEAHLHEIYSVRSAATSSRGSPTRSWTTPGRGRRGRWTTTRWCSACDFGASEGAKFWMQVLTALEAFEDNGAPARRPPTRLTRQPRLQRKPDTLFSDGGGGVGVWGRGF